ncbi:MAG: hypothetical protein AAGF24_09420 [Cyanobacteria bacterium P01_H01_bin.121]
MKRRDFYQGGLAAIAVWPALGHTPFPQWKVYRQVHLFVVVDREDATAYDLGQAIATTLATELPESRALLTRARDRLRLASLISTHQLDLALIQRSDFMAWQQGEPPFNQLESVPLQILFERGDYVLVSREDLRTDHAALVSQTLRSHLAA